VQALKDTFGKWEETMQDTNILSGQGKPDDTTLKHNDPFLSIRNKGKKHFWE